MPSVTLKAHFNGTQVVLDEPFSLEPHTRLLVTVVPDQNDLEREDWLRLSADHLGAAYGEDEPEYTLDDLKETNPGYERR